MADVERVLGAVHAQDRSALLESLHESLGAMRRRLQLGVEHRSASSVALYDRDLRLCLCEGQLLAHVDARPHAA